MLARWLVVVAIAIPQFARADLAHEDPELPRPTLKSMTATRFEIKLGQLAEVSREVRNYDANGRISRHEHRQGNKLVVAYDYAWDAQGRLQRRTYREGSGRVESRTFTYKLDANGRVVERIMHDPSKDPKEYYRYEYVWAADGSRTETGYRHYPKEGPYRDSQDTYDKLGRPGTQCSIGSGVCSMNEYDAHGNVSRVRQQNREQHNYLVYENTYDSSGRLARRIHGGTDTTFTWNARGDVVEVVDREIAKNGGKLRDKTVYTYVYR
jgi:YD repeat-containing protein